MEIKEFIEKFASQFEETDTSIDAFLNLNTMDTKHFPLDVTFHKVKTLKTYFHKQDIPLYSLLIKQNKLLRPDELPTEYIFEEYSSKPKK